MIDSQSSGAASTASAIHPAYTVRSSSAGSSSSVRTRSTSRTVSDASRSASAVVAGRRPWVTTWPPTR